MKRKPLVISLALVGVGVICLTASALFSPSFVETYLSPDQLLEVATARRVEFVQGVAGLLGILSLFTSLLIWPLHRFILRQSGHLSQLSTVVLGNLLLTAIIVTICFVRVDNLPPIKTGGPPSCYGLKILLLSDEEKLLYTGGYFDASISYINHNTPEGSLILVTEDPGYFYRAKRPGIYWRDLRMGPFYEADSIEDAYRFLSSVGIDYLQISGRTTGKRLFQDSYFEEVLVNPDMCTLIWDCGGSYPTRVFRLERAE